MLKRKEKNLIIDLLDITNDLKQKGIIRSTKVFGDIAEYICIKLYNLNLNESQREVGYDATDKFKNKYQIKFNNSKEMTNQKIGTPNKYDTLLLIITNQSKLFNASLKSFIAIYKISSKNVCGKDSIAKKFILGIKPDLELDNNLNKINYKRRKYARSKV